MKHFRIIAVASLLAATVVPAAADDISGADRVGIQRTQRFIEDPRITPAITGGPGQDIEPTRGNHRDAERQRARVDEMNARHAAC